MLQDPTVLPNDRINFSGPSGVEKRETHATPSSRTHSHLPRLSLCDLSSCVINWSGTIRVGPRLGERTVFSGVQRCHTVPVRRDVQYGWSSVSSLVHPNTRLCYSVSEYLDEEHQGTFRRK